ncbi:MAG: hypothetical protein QM820_26140 [Minicystis sp.]
MRSLLLSLMCAASLAIPATVRALPVDTKLDMVILDGPDPLNVNNVGTIGFKLDSDLGDACRYAGAWDASFAGTIMARCSLDELKTHGHGSCFANSQVAFSSMLIKDPRASCSGVDRFGQQQDIFLLIGAEMGDLSAIVGIIQWTAALPILSAFEAQPPP